MSQKYQYILNQMISNDNDLLHFQMWSLLFVLKVL